MPKKTRIAGSFTSTPPRYNVTYYKRNGTKEVWTTSAQPAYTRRIGTTSTIVTNNGNDGRFRPCSHTTMRYSATPVSALASTQLSLYSQGVTPTSVYMAAADNAFHGVHGINYFRFEGAIGAYPSLASVNWATLSGSAMLAMLPSFHTSNSLVNFILELKDFKNVVKFMGNGLKTKVDRINTFRLRRPKGALLSDNYTVDFDKGKPLKWLSKRYLEYNFGWRPLFNDVLTLYNTIAKFEKRYKEIVAGANQPQQKRWQTVIAGSGTSETVYYSDYSGINSSSWIGSFLNKIRSEVKISASPGITYSASLRLKYQIPQELLTAGGKLKAFLDTLGIARNPAVLWNAIPFSFIIDWIVNVSKFLEHWRLDNIEFKTEILDFCHSAKVQKHVVYNLSANRQLPNGSYSWDGWYQTDSCTVTNYERKIGLPDYRLAMQSSGLNLRELALSGALMGVSRGH